MVLVFLFSMCIKWGAGQGSLFFLMDIQFIDTYFLLFTVPLMDKNFLFLLDYFGPSAKNQVTPRVGIGCSVFCSIALWTFMPLSQCIDYHSFSAYWNQVM